VAAPLDPEVPSEGSMLSVAGISGSSEGVRGMKNRAAGIIASSTSMLIKTRGDRKIERRAFGGATADFSIADQNSPTRAGVGSPLLAAFNFARHRR
jgi:hypothetical protein